MRHSASRSLHRPISNHNLGQSMYGIMVTVYKNKYFSIHFLDHETIITSIAVMYKWWVISPVHNIGFTYRLKHADALICSARLLRLLHTTIVILMPMAASFASVTDIFNLLLLHQRAPQRRALLFLNLAIKNPIRMWCESRAEPKGISYKVNQRVLF